MNLEITNKLEKIVLSSIYSFILIYVFKDFITYKIAYAFQFLILIYLIFNLNYFKLKKIIIFLNLPLIFILFFEFDKSYVYLITLAFLNSLLLINNKDLNVIIKKKNILIFIFFYFLFLVAATDNQTFLLQDIIRALYHFHYFGYKYGFLDLNPSYTAIIFTSVALLYVKKLNNKEFYYYIFLLIISIITIFGSKVALLFTIVCFLSSLKFVNKKLLISTFVLINLVVFFLGYLTIKKLPNPYIHSEYYGKKEKFENYKNSQDQITDYYYIQAQTYDEIICPNIKVIL